MDNTITKRIFHHFNIKNRIALSFGLILICAFLLLILVFRASAGWLLVEKSSEELAKTLRQANISLEERINSMVQLSDFIFNDDNISKVLSNPVYSEGSVEEYTDYVLMTKTFEMYLFFNSNLATFVVVGENDKLYQYGNYIDYITNYKERDWYINAKKMNGSINWIGVRKSYDNGHSYITLSRLIKDLKTDQPLGAFLIEIDEVFIHNILKEISGDKKSLSFVADRNGDIVSASVRETADDTFFKTEVFSLTEKLTENNGHFITDFNGKQMIINYSTSNVTGWKLINSTPVSTVTENVNTITTILLIIVGILFWGIIYISYLVSTSITKPLEKFVEGVKEIEIGNMDVKIDTSSDDEISVLAIAFNNMIDELKSLMKKIKDDEASKKILEIEILQNQINPHFIYNTLESIHMVCELNDDEEGAEMTSILGLLLRYGMSYDDSLSTIKDEISQIENYILLMKYRFGDTFDICYDIDDDVKNTPIQKVTLQPIVENCIYHGFGCIDYKGFVKISAKKDGDNVIVKVYDNGRGFDIKTIAVKKQSSNHGIGIHNIDERIKLHFGEQYGVSTTSSVNSGTTVTIKLPCK